MLTLKIKPSGDEQLLKYSMGIIAGYLADYDKVMSTRPSYSERTNTITYLELQQEIDDFMALKKDWDGNDAYVISPIAAAVARRTLTQLNTDGLLSSEIAVNVFPMRDGGIQFDFDGEEMSSELEIDPDGLMHLLFYDEDGELLDEPYKLFQAEEIKCLLENYIYGVYY